VKGLPGMINKPENEAPNNNGMCLECGTGVLKLRHITYFTWLNNELITVPDFPAYVCDICGRREYDSRAITLLNTLLNPETGRRSIAPLKAESTGVNQAQP
jgi:YgiT-type zinc finger domain-containing protein